MRVFIIPPAVFSLFYNIFSTVMAFRGFEANENLYVNLFSMIILALFIWAFYVVITNINATNDPEPSSDYGMTASVCNLVSGDIAAFTAGAEQSDDITMLCIRYLEE